MARKPAPEGWLVPWSLAVPRIAVEATPGSRVSALASDRDVGEDEPVPLPDPTTTPSFTTHIKPLFRATDRESMRSAFDLWSHEDVSRHADAILARLRDGTMPCDGAWPPESVEVFQRWLAAGTPP
jgi:hypothetical protein